MTTPVLSDDDLSGLTKEDKKNLLDQRLRGLRVTLASSLLDRASIEGLDGYADQVAGSDRAINELRVAINLHETELAALDSE